MKILVTGGAGYVGSTLSMGLSEAGHEVLAVDVDPSRIAHMRARTRNKEGSPLWLRLSLDDLLAHRALLGGVDAVVHLAGIASDSLAERDPEATHRVNVDLTVAVARACREAGVKRFLFASTVAIYQVPQGHAREHDLFHEDDLPPLSEPMGVYARSKLAAEQALLQMSDVDFSISVLRKGSLFGSAPVMRWDLVINRTVLAAWRGGPIVLHDLGSVWRPIAHVHDAARAYAHLLTMPTWTSNGRVFNVVEKNARMSEIFLEVHAVLSSVLGRAVDLRHGTSQFPQRSGRASGEVLRQTGWRPTLGLDKGVEDLLQQLHAGGVLDPGAGDSAVLTGGQQPAVASSTFP